MKYNLNNYTQSYVKSQSGQNQVDDQAIIEAKISWPIFFYC